MDSQVQVWIDIASGICDLDRKKGTLQALLFLYAHGPAAKTSISRSLGQRHETVGKTLKILRQSGLILSEKDVWFPYRETFRLTSLGKILVETPLHGWPGLLRQDSKQPAAPT